MWKVIFLALLLSHFLTWRGRISREQTGSITLTCQCVMYHTHPHTFRHAVKKKKKKKENTNSDEKTKSHYQVGKVGQWFVRGWTENSPSASACWAAPQSTTSKASMTRTERENRGREREGEMEMWREECWEDELIQAEACWHVRSLCTVFLCVFLSPADREGLWKVRCWSDTRGERAEKA